MALTLFQPGQRISSALMNANFAFLQSLFGAAVARHFDQNDATTAALVWGFVGGVVRSSTNAVNIVNSGTVALTPNATNRVELDPTTGAVSVQTTASWTLGKIALRLLVTNDFAVTTNTDVRAWAAAAPATQWADVQNKPATFTPSAHDHTRLANGSATLSLAADGSLAAGNFKVLADGGIEIPYFIVRSVDGSKRFKYQPDNTGAFVMTEVVS